MIKHIWSVLCRKSIIDSETNNISLNEIFESLQVDLKVQKNEKGDTPKQFNIPIEFEVVSLWTKEEKKNLNAELRISVTPPEGQTRKFFEKAIEIPERLNRLRSRVKVRGITIENGGVYTFIVELKESGDKTFKVVSTIPLEVIVSKKLD